MKDRKKVLLEIELEGARQVRKSFPEAFQLFIAPPNFQELEARIRGRATDSEESIKKRLDRAEVELKAQNIESLALQKYKRLKKVNLQKISFPKVKTMYG